MIKKITLTGLLLIGTSIMQAQHVIETVRAINIKADTDSQGGNEGISLYAANKQLAYFTPANNVHLITTFFDKDVHFVDLTYFRKNVQMNEALNVSGTSTFSRAANFNNGFTVKGGNTNFELGTFSAKTSASFVAHIDKNSNDPNVDTFKVLYGTNGTKVFDVGVGYTKVLSRNFLSENDGGFVVNVDKNNNSEVDKFKVLYGSEKREVLTAGKNDVTINTKLITTNNIQTKNITALDILANRVTLNVGSFPDYVFANDYNLMPLREVAKYIKENKHLPNMPSEAEVLENGMSIGQINTILVEKIEELTLHTISQEEKITTLLKELEEIKEAIKSSKK